METIFACSRCKTVDLIGFCFPLGLPSDTTKQLCTRCSTGSWHGMFPEEKYNPELDHIANAAAVTSGIRDMSLSLG